MNIPKLLISGGRERPDGFSLGEGKYYHQAVLLELDINKGTYKPVFEKLEGGKNYPLEHPNLQFTAACTFGSTLWLPTDTEIYKVCLPGYEVVQVISHPCFQNVHSVHVIDNELVVTSTGLDNVVFMDAESGEIKRIVNAEGKHPWHRFSQDVDYRHIHSTRPHDCHPNYVFKLGDELWVTRCRQEDAVCLSDVSKIMDITHGDATSVHDGVHWGNKIVFSRVDGQLVIYSSETRKYLNTVDPFNNRSNRPTGWCRGLCVQGDVIYLGYSKIRKTRLTDKLKFLTKGNFKFSSGNNALIVAFDMKKKQVINIYETPSGMIDAIYGVIKYPDL